MINLNVVIADSEIRTADLPFRMIALLFVQKRIDYAIDNLLDEDRCYAHLVE